MALHAALNNAIIKKMGEITRAISNVSVALADR